MDKKTLNLLKAVWAIEKATALLEEIGETTQLLDTKCYQLMDKIENQNELIFNLMFNAEYADEGDLLRKAIEDEKQ